MPKLTTEAKARRRAEREARRRVDRELVESNANDPLGFKYLHLVSLAKQAGHREQITVSLARQGASEPTSAPDWLRFAFRQREAAEEARRQADRERADKVWNRLLAGAKHFRNSDDEMWASDFAFRAMKDLVRCDGDVSYLNDGDLAALAWAGVNPADQETWFITRG